MLESSPPSLSFLFPSLRWFVHSLKQYWLNPSSVPDVFLALPGIGGVLLTSCLPGVCCWSCCLSVPLCLLCSDGPWELPHPLIDPGWPDAQRRVQGLASPPLCLRLPTPSQSLSPGTPFAWPGKPRWHFHPKNKYVLPPVAFSLLSPAGFFFFLIWSSSVTKTVWSQGLL